MSIATVIYLASIASQIQGFLIGLTCILGFMFLVMVILKTGFTMDTEPPKKVVIESKIRVYQIFLTFMIFMFSWFSAASIPSADNIYKIAGVTAQEKASIDASGTVIQIKSQQK